MIYRGRKRWEALRPSRRPRGRKDPQGILGALRSTSVFMFLAAFAFSNIHASDILELGKKLETLTPAEHSEYEHVAERLRCPTCNGLSIMQSDAPFSIQIRRAVYEQIKQGKSEPQILDFFTERYGLWILREPPKEGFHLLAWAIPLASFVLGVFCLWFFYWRRMVAPEGVARIRRREELAAEMQSELERLRAAAPGGV